MIKIENLKLQFGSAFCLSVNELSLPNSGLFLIEGKNGSGKSTFLEVFAGRIKPESLSLVVDEKTLMNKELLQFQQSQIHFVHQNSLVFPELSCLENVLLPFYNPDKDKARECLKQVQLDKLANQKASQLSSGEKQRLSFCRVLYEHRPILLLEEITSNLDSESTNIIEGCIGELAKTSLVLFVTHENSSLSDSSECIRFENGKTIESPSIIKSENRNNKSEYKRKGWLNKGFFRNKRKYLLLRSMGYKEKSLIQEDVFLHFFSFLLIVLTSFAISEIVLAVINRVFVSRLSTSRNRYYFAHSYLPFWICMAGVFLLTIVFFVLDRFILVKMDRSKEINQLKTK